MGKQRSRCPRCFEFINEEEESLPSLAYSLEHDAFFKVNCHIDCRLFANKSKVSSWLWYAKALGYKASYGWRSRHPEIEILAAYYVIQIGKERVQVRCYRHSDGRRLVLDGEGQSYTWSTRDGWLRVGVEETRRQAKALMGF